MDFQRNCNYKGNLHQWSNLAIKACSMWNFSTEIWEKFLWEQRSSLNPSGDFHFLLAASAAQINNFPTFSQLNPSSILEISRKSQAELVVKVKRRPKISQSKGTGDYIQMSQTQLKLCLVIAQNFLSPLTKPHNTAGSGESPWEETFLSGPGSTLLDSHQTNTRELRHEGRRFNQTFQGLQVAHGWWCISPRSWKHPYLRLIFNFCLIWSFNIK